MSCGFVTIGGITDAEGNDAEGINLVDLVPECDSCDGDIFIEVLNDAGVTIEGKTYSYFKGNFDYSDGWWSDWDEKVGEDIDVAFTAGTGLWVTGVDGTTWRNCGQVYEADKAIPLADNKQMLSNPYPTELNLATDIDVDCDSCDGDVFIEMLNDAGVTIEGQTYSYFKGNFDYADGWWTDWDEQVGEDIDVKFPAGQGLWVTGVEGTTFLITSPLK